MTSDLKKIEATTRLNHLLDVGKLVTEKREPCAHCQQWVVLCIVFPSPRLVDSQLFDTETIRQCAADVRIDKSSLVVDGVTGVPVHRCPDEGAGGASASNEEGGMPTPFRSPSASPLVGPHDPDDIEGLIDLTAHDDEAPLPIPVRELLRRQANEQQFGRRGA